MRKKILYILLIILILLLILLISFRFIYDRYYNDEGNDVNSIIKQGVRWYSKSMTVFSSEDTVKENIDNYSEEYLYFENNLLYLCDVSSSVCDSYSYKIDGNLINLYNDNDLIKDIQVDFDDYGIYVVRKFLDGSGGFSICTYMYDGIG